MIANTSVRIITGCGSFVRRRRLLNDSLECRMRIKHGHHREPRAIAGSGDPSPAVVVGHIFQEPFNRVVSVSAFVDGGFVLWIPRLPKHHKLTFRLEPSANVLLHHDETFSCQFGKCRCNLSWSRVADAIWRSQKKEGKLLGAGGRVDARVKPDTIPHGDHRVSASKKRLLILGIYGREGWDADQHQNRDT